MRFRGRLDTSSAFRDHTIGEVYDVDVKSLYGFKAGLWCTPTATRYWIAAIVIRVAVARQRSIRLYQDARRKVSG
jgi:hypothetical protein